MTFELAIKVGGLVNTVIIARWPLILKKKIFTKKMNLQISNNTSKYWPAMQRQIKTSLPRRQERFE